MKEKVDYASHAHGTILLLLLLPRGKFFHKESAREARRRFLRACCFCKNVRPDRKEVRAVFPAGEETFKS